MKRSWQFGLLAMAFTGVSTYNVLFFKEYQSPRPAAEQVEALSVAATADGPEGSGPEDFGGQIPISREELEQMALQEFAPQEEPVPESLPWPSRDPFSAYPQSAPAQSAPKKTDFPIKESPTSADLQAPQCLFSGTLIDQERRLALIDGRPLSVGARVGSWQLAHIESDHIILQSGDKMRRIELANAGRQAAPKEPL